MILDNLLKHIEVEIVTGNTLVDVVAIQFDSRKVTKGNMFVAVKGTVSDGHNYISQVIDAGATVIVCESFPHSINNDVTYVKVQNSALALGQLASAFYGNPSKQIKLVGITGTNGKTTTVTLLHQLFVNLGYKVGLLSTIKNLIHTRVVDATHTTPDPVQLNALLAQMVNEGCEYCFMEVSSHSIHQHRIAGLEFAGAIFSNITQDHLDYHKTFKEYIIAKKAYFDNLPNTAFALINADDKNGSVMVQNTKAKVYKYGLKSMADYKARIIEAQMDGMCITLNNKELWTRFIGEFNVYNILAVYATALLLGQNSDEVMQAVSLLKPVEGRFEYLQSSDGKLAIVDYAHTPDALENVLKTIKGFIVDGQEIITVVGAGGNRDKGKRPIMAKVAATLSNRVILTADNPRNEDPETIISEMKAGVLPPLNNKVLCITNREEAIRTACALARPDDVILVAGKGHETYQEINGVKYPFDDKKVINQTFQNIS